ncbi:MAG: hypothetical protein IKR91_02800, partial [Alloprevotella sp.]|nr:hypothetical protein [Alloprevotella sp.]
KEIFGLLKVIFRFLKEILKFFKEIFAFLRRKNAKKWLGFSKIKRKSKSEFCIHLKVSPFRKMQKTGIFWNFFRGDDFYAHFLSSKTGVWDKGFLQAPCLPPNPLFLFSMLLRTCKTTPDTENVPTFFGLHKIPVYQPHKNVNESQNSFF